ncbi:ParE toxin of type II toxin-antitoxin system, parDE [Actinacidiphila yanglinensis]|uniref:ParE toxin of type II toxin-antitoxin system, parDE n=1 Tax=Actinacidiphila yanglinensis TaxID=310779 RepID=A0A1H6ECY1_9ACTN|nr:type II toxin-antitoxin system RelE/ParE family toxin [Actinacidiphila yanglinensis]SEG94806.1 ParE toxin of type II toxin-antitoxin system, parDE [Actinacidiphila yanglinensis]
MPRHSRPRARITFSESAQKQIEALADEAQLLALDRALAVLSVDPDAGAPIPGSRPGLRDYRDDVDDVRVIYFVTALGTVVVVSYIEA